MRTALRGRFASKRIYTHVNNLLVAVNPYEELPLYGIDVLHSYTQYGEKSPAPHVFGVGAATYRGLLDARSQSVIISGESGAGKTESAKKFLQYLAYAATLGGGVTTAEAKLEQRVIAEAFTQVDHTHQASHALGAVRANDAGRALQLARAPDPLLEFRLEFSRRPDAVIIIRVQAGAGLRRSAAPAGSEADGEENDK